MKVTDKDVAYVAELANLELTAEERVGMLRDLNSILEYVDRLSELDTSNVAPMAQVSDRIRRLTEHNPDSLPRLAQNAWTFVRQL